MSNPISTLLVSIGADTSGLQDGVNKAGKGLDGLGKKSSDLSAKLAGLTAAAAAAGAAVVAGLVTSGLRAIDAQAKLARAVDGTIDGLRGLQMAAGDAGISNEELGGALRMLNARLGEAQRGTGNAAKALQQLGLDARAVSQLDVDQRMAVIADRIRELGMSSSQAADVLRQFGIRNENLVTLMRQGGDAIRAARQEVDDYGLSLSKVDAAKVEMANDAMQRIGRVMESIRNQLTIAFAPILKEIADRFNAVAKEQQGFSGQAQRAAEMMIRGFAKVADVIQGLRVVLKGTELIATGFGAAFVSAGQLIIEVFAKISDGVAAAINFGIRAVNKLGASIDEIPMFENSGFMQSLRSFGDEARDRVGKVRTELHDLAMQELPSAKVEAFFDAVKKRAQEAAEAMSAAEGGGGEYESENEADSKAEERRQKEIERHREALQAKLDAIREFAMTEEELEIYRHETRMAKLFETLEAELLAEGEYKALKETLEEEHAKRITDIRRKGLSDLEKFTNASYSKQVGLVSGHLADMTAGVARENRAMFEINKAAGIANATVSMFEGISKTLGAYPFPVNAIMAAAHAASAVAQISAIKSSSFSGGGAAPSLAGGTPATPVTPVSGGTPASAGGGSTLFVENIDPESLFSGRAVRALAERLAEHTRDGGTVQFA